MFYDILILLTVVPDPIAVITMDSITSGILDDPYQGVVSSGATIIPEGKRNGALFLSSKDQSVNFEDSIKSTCLIQTSSSICPDGITVTLWLKLKASGTVFGNSGVDGLYINNNGGSFGVKFVTNIGKFQLSNIKFVDRINDIYRDSLRNKI